MLSPSYQFKDSICTIIYCTLAHLSDLLSQTVKALHMCLPIKMHIQ